MWECGVCGLPAAVGWVFRATLTSPKQTSASTTRIWAWGTVPPGHELLQSCWCPSPRDRGPSKPLFLHGFFLNSILFFFPLLLLFHPHLEKKNAGSCMLLFPYATENFCLVFSPHTYMEQCIISICCLKKECFPFSPQFLETDRIIL